METTELNALPESERYYYLLRKYGGVKGAWRVFLKTEFWKRQKSEKFREVGKKCERCGLSKNDGAIIEVHHINYKRLFDCGNSDLEVICQKCHSKHHKLEKR